MAPHTPKAKEGGKTHGERREERLSLIKYEWQAKGHHCAICKVPTSHPSMECLYKHQEVCKMFHETLHVKDKGRECDACRNTEEKRHERHAKIANAIVDLNDPEEEAPSSSRKGKGKKPVVARVVGKDIELVSDVMYPLFYTPVARIEDVRADEGLVDRNFTFVKSKDFKPTKIEAELCPAIVSSTDTKTLKRHARVYAAFRLELAKTSGNAKTRTNNLEKFWSRIKETKTVYENEQAEFEKRDGFKVSAGIDWEKAVAKN